MSVVFVSGLLVDTRVVRITQDEMLKGLCVFPSKGVVFLPSEIRVMFGNELRDVLPRVVT